MADGQGEAARGTSGQVSNSKFQTGSLRARFLPVGHTGRRVGPMGRRQSDCFLFGILNFGHARSAGLSVRSLMAEIITDIHMVKANCL